MMGLKFHVNEINYLLHAHNKIVREHLQGKVLDLKALEVCELGAHGWVPCPTEGHTFPYRSCLYREKPE